MDKISSRRRKTIFGSFADRAGRVSGFGLARLKGLSAHVIAGRELGRRMSRVNKVGIALWLKRRFSPRHGWLGDQIRANHAITLSVETTGIRIRVENFNATHIPPPTGRQVADYHPATLMTYISTIILTLSVKPSGWHCVLYHLVDLTHPHTGTETMAVVLRQAAAPHGPGPCVLQPWTLLRSLIEVSALSLNQSHKSGQG